MRSRTLAVRIGFALGVLLAPATLVAAQSSAPTGGATTSPTPSSARISIPFLANARRPDDLDFQAGECELDQAGTTLHCAFQQAFLTTSPLHADTCLITTNRYERVFRKESDTLWTSRGEPQGECRVVEVTSLRHEGGIKWTLETRSTVTATDPRLSCDSNSAASETLTWDNLRRRLPCAYVQPGALLP